MQPLEVYNMGKTRIKSQIPSLRNIFLNHLVNIFLELFLIVCVHMFTLSIYLSIISHSHLYNFTSVCLNKGFPDGVSGKEHNSQCRRHKRHRFDPWVGKIPWKRAWQPTPVFLPGESHRQRSLAGYSP